MENISKNEILSLVGIFLVINKTILWTGFWKIIKKKKWELDFIKNKVKTQKK